jgi:acetyl-CoA carboxylase biotin carboxyl carrier protein
MAGPASNMSELFDLKKIRRLAELMAETDLSEIDLTTGDNRLRLRRRIAGEGVVETRVVTAPSAAAPARPAAAAAGPAPAEGKLAVIKSPMVGTFYTSPSPDAKPFVKVGDHVGPETTVCIIEAMKVFNEIPAETAGKIVAVLVENGEAVEFGQPLFKVDQGQ